MKALLEKIIEWLTENKDEDFIMYHTDEITYENDKHIFYGPDDEIL